MKTIYVVSTDGYGDGPVFGDAFLSKDEAVKQAEEYTADKVDDLVYYVDEVKLHED
ncbi:hypothetical protein [Limosilactobacillus reuteri]